MYYFVITQQQLVRKLNFHQSGIDRKENILAKAMGQRAEWGTDRLLTAEEVALREGIKLQTLYAWRLTPGRGPRAIKVGKYLRYRLADVIAWEDSNLDPKVA